MSQKHIATLITTIDTIPPLPEISAAVMKALNAEEVAIVEVGDLIEKDIALTSQILKVANSPAFGASNTIGNIHHAIMMLGLDEVRALLLAFAVEKFFSTEARDTALRKRYWRHARVCSYTALLLAHHFQQGDSGTFFLSGLIHDIGKVIIDQFLHDEFEEIVAYVMQHNSSFSEAEEEILGLGHAQIGGRLLQHWNFPDQVTRQVLCHHQPWHEKKFTAGASIIFLANTLTKIAGHSCLVEEKVPSLAQFSSSKAMNRLREQGLGLDPDTLAGLIEQIKEFVTADKAA